MSEFTNKAEDRINQLVAYFTGLMHHDNGSLLATRYQIQKTQFTPQDVVMMFDRIFDQNPDMEVVKTASNKMFNMLFKTLSAYQSIDAPTASLIYFLQKNNAGMLKLLNELKPQIKHINIEVTAEQLIELASQFKTLQLFLSHYLIKENIIFPYIENNWDNTSCLRLMWSLHDDVRRNIKKTIELLQSKSFDLITFNKISSKVFFNMNTLKFREEKVLFPVLLEKIDTDVLDDMLEQAKEFGLYFVELGQTKSPSAKRSQKENLIHFKTGSMTLEQAELIFSHLPVDITFVDEADTVKYFSNPKHRIFPRTTGIIGRKVQNCHPHESVDVVNRIVASFKNGEKEVASFWIHMGPKYVLIQYFAVRDEAGHFKGTLEVSQDISALQKITGDKRLLDWEE